MIPKDCKRLAEVDFPIAVVSAHAAREKSIRHGHPSTLHLWWARRPLASSRAMLMALLLPDPCDPHCPEDFRKQAREILGEVRQTPKNEEELQKALLWFIGSFANWDLSADSNYLRAARSLVKAAHPEGPPLVVDPFAGGGSIPLEALRLGCEAFATDLNPVACLILKIMLEDIPRHGPQLAEELRRVGAEIKAQAESGLADFYPKDPDGATPIAYLWARTVRCEAPNCGAEIPLLRTFWLCKKATRRQALRPKIVRFGGRPPEVEFEIFEPKDDREVPSGTVTRAKASCPCCGSVLPPERVRSQLAAQRGGADVVFDAQCRRVGGARMTAVVTLRPGKTGRHYRLPRDSDYAAVSRAHERLVALLETWERGGRQGPCPVPDEPLPPIGTLGFRVQRYGMLQWGDLFTSRQKVSLLTLGRLAGERPGADEAAIRTAMAVVVSRCVDYGSAITSWAQSGEFVRSTFGRQALPIVWDFAEAVPWTDSSGNFEGALDWVARVVESWPGSAAGQVQQADATDHPQLPEAANVWFTDPPYYDAVPYADLSDFFLVWLKRTLPGHPLLRDPFDRENPLSPKTREAVQDETKRHNDRPKNREWFEKTMAAAFTEGRRVLREDGIASVVFAHKTTEGWEALLSGLIRGGWTITGSWPIATERPGRLRSQESAALSTSVHLICRPRREAASVGDWAEVLRALPRRAAAWMDRLQAEGVRGADLVFACIGPALEVFSRFERVETAEGREVKLPEYLERVWEVVGRAALEQVLGAGGPGSHDAATGALEEDARLSALFLWTLQSTDARNGNSANGSKAVGTEEDEADDEALARSPARGLSLPFDVVRRFAQPLGIGLPAWEGRVIETSKGVVRLLPVAERAKALFGEYHAEAVADWIESEPCSNEQQMLFPEIEAMPKKKRRGRMKVVVGTNAELQSSEATTLERVHAAMLLQAGGRTNALRTLISNERERGSGFLRLANALSALYPKGSEEKRLLDAMLLAVPR